MPIAPELRADIEGALEDCRHWMRSVAREVKATADETDNREIRISIRSLGNFVDQAEGSLRELEDLIKDLINDSRKQDGGSAEELRAALQFYAKKRNYDARRGKESKVTVDGGAAARAALGGESEDGGEE